MKKYIITDRRCGLGDAILNLAASWYLAKEHGCGVIIDWRRLPYTLKNEETFERHHLNLYNSIYSLPDPIDGVSFHFPEEFPEVFFGPKTQQGHPYDLDHLPCIEQEEKNEESILKYLSESRFVRNTMRFGQANKIYPVMRRVSGRKFSYWDFFKNLPILDSIKEELDEFSDYAINEKTVAIHFRHGNGETIMGRGPNWISPEEAVEEIVKEAKGFLGSPLEDYNYCIFSDHPEGEKLLLQSLPNSYCKPKTLPPEGSGAIHFSQHLNPVVSFQESIKDMHLMTRCAYILWTHHSTFSLPARHFINKKNQHMLFKINNEVSL